MPDDPAITSASTVTGHVDEGWGPVADAFRRNFESKEQGAGVAVRLDGAPVVDLWGGTSDHRSGRPWSRDTVVMVMSATKGAASVCIHMLVEQDRLDLDAPVVRYWPEFGQNGKEDITVRWLVSHRANLPYVDTTLTFEDLCAGTPVVEALARQRPQWTPGQHHVYHAITWGFLVGELVRRVAGSTLGAYFHEQVARRLGLSAWIGLPAEEEPRVAHVRPAPTPTDPQLVQRLTALMGPDTVVGRALGLGGALPLGLVTDDGAALNSRAARAAELPSVNLMTDAASLAKMYAATVAPVDGVRLLRPETLEAAITPQTDGSTVMGLPPGMEALGPRFAVGFMLTSPVAPFVGPHSFGHIGAGGCIGFGDVDARLGVGYVTNTMLSPADGDTRAADVVAAIRRCLG